MPIIGAHVSAAGGLYHVFENAKNINAQALQIFGASPRQWKANLPTAEILKKYHDAREKAGNPPVFLHAAYLVNLGSTDKELYKKSLENLATHLQIAELLKAEGLIYHIGSCKNSTTEKSFQLVADGMLKVLEKVPGNAHLIMENSAGGGDKIGTTLEEIGEIFHLANHPRIKVCIDTAHAFATGLLEKFTPAELEKFTKTAEKSFGLENLTVLHINDSKVPFNCKKDRHENLGEGHIGLQAFQNLAQHKYLGQLPWLLEVPGFDNQGPDKKNIEIANSLF